ncbi:MAG: hypothetical protein ACE5IY_06920 [bacterium]
MRNWDKFRDDIFDYIDGLLPLDARKRIDEQLQDDAEARAFYDQVKALKTRLRGLRSVKISPDFDTVLRTRIKMERSMSRLGGGAGTLRTPAMVTTGALAAVAIIFLLNLTDSKLSNRIPVSSSSFPSYQVSRNDSGNGLTNSLPVRYVPVDQVLLPQGGSAIDRLTPPNASKIDSSKHGASESPILQVEF